MKDHYAVPVEIRAEEAGSLVSAKRPLIDIRRFEERQLGVPAGTLTMNPGELLEKCLNGGGGENQAGFIICAEGIRSRDAVLQLRKHGFDQFSSVAGGFQAWVKAGLPVVYPAGLNSRQAERYARHLVMPQVGPEGQRKLLASRMLLVGLGGLNSPVSLYLAAAGVGSLGLADFDSVERSNLQRQIIHGESSLGVNKAESARDRIRDLNPDIETVVINRQIDRDNAGELVRDWDVIIDGTDSFPSRYALNEACVLHSKPLVFGAVMRFQGQVAVFWPAFRNPDPGANPNSGSAPCFRCLMPQAPAPGDAPGCSEAGVLGVLPGIVGALQANEALKLALGIGHPLIGQLMLIDALNMDFRQMRIRTNPACKTCGNRPLTPNRLD